MKKIILRLLPTSMYNRIMQMKRSDSFGDVEEITFDKDKVELKYKESINNSLKTRIKKVFNKLNIYPNIQ